MRLWLAINCLMLGACTAHYPEGVLACTKQTDCPSGWVCRLDRLCYSSTKVAVPNGAGASATAGGGTGGAAGAPGIIKRL